jgi:23S rRNA (adenine2503-C2)-methyltransferase
VSRRTCGILRAMRDAVVTAAGAPARRHRPTPLLHEGAAPWLAGVPPPPTVRRSISDGNVIKFCLPAGAAGADSFESESVIIPMRSYAGDTWYTLCVSSQIGCRMGCTFCETGNMGWLCNLSATEIVQQYHVAAEMVAPRTIDNVVFMGMGEPFDNFDAVIEAIRTLSDPHGLNLPVSRLTVSTVGRIDGLRKLAALPRDRNWARLRLAISLTAPNDRLRDQLVPLNRAVPLATLRQALLDYPLPRRGRFLIEYVLLGGVNDAIVHADQLADWCRGLPCIVNLIPYNRQRDAAYRTPSERSVQQFMAHLRRHGIFTKRRLVHGRTLMGACGQLGNPEWRRPEIATDLQ